MFLFLNYTKLDYLAKRTTQVSPSVWSRNKMTEKREEEENLEFHS